MGDQAHQAEQLSFQTFIFQMIALAGDFWAVSASNKRVVEARPF
jgi:hypothetical protein